MKYECIDCKELFEDDYIIAVQFPMSKNWDGDVTQIMIKYFCRVCYLRQRKLNMENE